MAKAKKSTKKTAAKKVTKKQPAKKAPVAKAAPAAATAPVVRDPRVPSAGTVLTRTYKGKDHKVKVLEHGFTYDGKTFKTVSGVAEHITQCATNGYVFFHLIPKAGK